MGGSGLRGGTQIETQLAADRAGIERLFVAVPVPAPVAAALCGMRPESSAGVAPIEPADMHITLHFLGNAQAGPVHAALATIRQPPFSLQLKDPGSFRLRDGRVILWAGIRPSAPLERLRDSVSTALAPLGFTAETRPYVPHITLARLRSGSAAGNAGTIADFQTRTVPAASRAFECDRFALYASRAAAAGLRYRIIGSFSLAA